MARRQCHHCKQWIESGEPHDCWTTTEDALTRHLSEDLRDAWDRLRETTAEFGEQRIYASHHSIMFARGACYSFVRPRKNSLELCVFLGRELKEPQVQRVERRSKTKVAHYFRIVHRDEVEAPLTEWLREAYNLPEAMPSAAADPPKKQRQAKQAGKTPMKRDNGKQLARVRRICQSLPGTTEKLSHGAPTFFTPKRGFAIFVNNHHNDGRVAVWLPAAEGVQAALIEEAPETYFRPPYVGVAGWFGVVLSKVDDEQLGALIRESFRFVNTKAISGRAAKSRVSKRR